MMKDISNTRKILKSKVKRFGQKQETMLVKLYTLMQTTDCSGKNSEIKEETIRVIFRRSPS